MNETTPGAPLTATVGERVGGDPHVEEVRKQVAGRSGAGGQRHGRAAVRRPFPWGALAIAAVGWALVTGIGRGIRSRARRLGAAAAGLGMRLAARVPGR